MISDANDPELNGKYIGTITKDFIKVSDILKEAAYQVRSRKFSEFPIFPMSKEAQPIGQMLLGKEEKNLDWNYYITYLDEFIQRKLIAEDLMEEFQKAYKDPDEFCCLFVMDNDFTKFVYIPYPED
ncbi:hypothetical protein P872_07185 [Rhodonellum psychrophilum GCM71 = DSM 17998]|uniref:Uncharacterized protein n=2 Tax=Rhodonellum TaxID=336827 RepID=U5BWB9_9BACT|nr:MULTISPECIES: hypothetical protein [Rhodonellum]ERM82183.1 hypothetical protein P872_07185 [Rhodonellum psychrophilum GCM71 = DSM 17998]MDO9551502.1 hypothetical protein [Rhodonellum sp.]SDZ41212.1 hypothetical protein SAMN05444412_113101 [Rhodonellum ikkaensis]